uniref:Uncharacterized protein n=1 Tax=Tanacetum cinerariifolium TaxID=118510 RepID=A0A6L2KW50_TANCI|nr:hypothetical protein [Tanacetum cinerariifolium]
MSSRVSNRTVNIAEPPRNQKPFKKSKDLACLTCKKCIYSANHDECILKYLSKVNYRASAQKKDAHPHKKTKRYIPIEKKSNSKKHDRQIPIGQKFSLNKSSAVYLKTTPPRSGLTWKLTGRIFTQVGLRWTPIRKSVETRYNTNDSALPLGKKTHNSNTTICANSSSLSAALVDDDVGKEESIENNTKVLNNNNVKDDSIEVDEVVNVKESKNHPLEQVIGNLNQRTLSSQAQNHSNFFCFISTIEPTNVKEALGDGVRL